jgi:tetratricopeptide (TPR) repeat protein
VWGDRFERNIADLFALQSEITSRIAMALSVAMVSAEALRPTEHPEVLDYIFRGRAAGLKPISRDSIAEQIGWFERALALDPQSAEAQSRVALALTSRVLSNNSTSAAADIERAERLTRQALAAAPQNYLSHLASGQLLRLQRRCAEAMPEYEMALSFNRNLPGALFGLGQCNLKTGAIEETIPLLDQAIRLGPRDPNDGVSYWQIGLVHLLQSRTEEAIVWFEKARNANPAQSLFHAYLASACGLKGDTERAAAELSEARKLAANNQYTSIDRLRASLDVGIVPKIHGLYEATYLAGLRKAGMSEE